MRGVPMELAVEEQVVLPVMFGNKAIEGRHQPHVLVALRHRVLLFVFTRRGSSFYGLWLFACFRCIFDGALAHLGT